MKWKSWEKEEMLWMMSLRKIYKMMTITSVWIYLNGSWFIVDEKLFFLVNSLTSSFHLFFYIFFERARESKSNFHHGLAFNSAKEAHKFYFFLQHFISLRLLPYNLRDNILFTFNLNTSRWIRTLCFFHSLWFFVLLQFTMEFKSLSVIFYALVVFWVWICWFFRVAFLKFSSFESFSFLCVYCELKFYIFKP